MTRFALVDQEKALYAFVVLCRLLKVGTAEYYAWIARPPSARQVAGGVMTAQIQTAFDDNGKVYEALRIHAEPADADVHVGCIRVRRDKSHPGVLAA